MPAVGTTPGSYVELAFDGGTWRPFPPPLPSLPPFPRELPVQAAREMTPEELSKRFERFKQIIAETLAGEAPGATFVADVVEGIRSVRFPFGTVYGAAARNYRERRSEEPFSSVHGFRAEISFAGLVVPLIIEAEDKLENLGRIVRWEIVARTASSLMRLGALKHLSACPAFVEKTKKITSEATFRVAVSKQPKARTIPFELRWSGE